jgi:predicted nucleic acid-binding Zn ribbon protein
MAPIHCPGCGEEISDKDKPCPRCGYQKDPKFVKKLLIFTILFIVLGALWLLFLTKDLGSS